VIRGSHLGGIGCTSTSEVIFGSMYVWEPVLLILLRSWNSLPIDKQLSKLMSLINLSYLCHIWTQSNIKVDGGQSRSMHIIDAALVMAGPLCIVTGCGCLDTRGGSSHSLQITQKPAVTSVMSHVHHQRAAELHTHRGALLELRLSPSDLIYQKGGGGADCVYSRESTHTYTHTHTHTLTLALN